MPLIKDIKGIYLIQRINADKNEALYYVGQSVGVFNRWKQHCNGNEQNIDKAIQKFGCLNFAFTILEVVSKRVDLDSCETKWINTYKEKGEKLMFNISQTANPNPHLIVATTKNEIKKLFEEEIGRSIYAIAEKHEIGFKDVINIRKPLLKKQGLKYDMRTKNIVDANGQCPDNWKGTRVTKNMSEKIIALKAQDIDNDDIAYECNISTIDLKLFFNEYKEIKDKYDFAETIICKMN
jgi:group I intron endonuclease